MSGKDRPGATVPTVSAESLLAELAAARRAGAGGHLAPSPEEPETRRKSGSAFGRLLVFGAVAVVLFVVITMSSLRNRVPGIDRAAYAFEQFLDRYVTIIR